MCVHPHQLREHGRSLACRLLEQTLLAVPNRAVLTATATAAAGSGCFEAVTEPELAQFLTPWVAASLHVIRQQQSASTHLEQEIIHVA